MTRREGRGLEVADAVALVALLALVFVVSARKLGDFDLPMHVATGRYVWQNARIPGPDPFSYLGGTVRYVELVSVSLFYGALRLAGPLGLQVVGGLSAGGVALALWAQTRRFGPSGLVATALAIAGASSFLVVRSSALSFLLLALSTAVLDVHRRATTPRAARRALWAYVALMLVWANTHGSVTLGLVLGAAYVAHKALCRVARGRAGALLPPRDGADAGVAAIALGFALVAASLSTAGPPLLLGPLRFGGKLAELGAFSEWARPTRGFFVDQEPVALAALVVGAVAALLGRDVDTGSRTPALFDALVAALAFACGLTAVRLVPVALVLLAPFVARRFAGLLSGGVRAVRLACSAVALFAAARVMAAPAPTGVGFDRGHLPEGAVEWIEAHHPAGHLWNSSAFGGYLTMRLFPGLQVLMDGRNGLAYDLDDVDAVEASEHDAGAFEALVARHEIAWAVARSFEGGRSGGPIAASRDWAMVYLDDVAAIYVRKGGPDGALAPDGYRVLRHATDVGAVLAAAVRGGARADDLSHDGALALSQAPASPRAAVLDGCGAIASRDEARLRSDLARIEALAPGHPAAGVLASAWAEATGTHPDSR